MFIKKKNHSNKFSVNSLGVNLMCDNFDFLIKINPNRYTSFRHIFIFN